MLVLRALAVFGLLITSAALVYPGGTWWEPTRRGFSFWHNFWCDLLSTEALDGESNLLGSVLARAAFASFALALLKFWPLAIACAQARSDHPARTLGKLGALGLLAVALVPASNSQIAHGVAVVSATGASLIAVSMLLPRLQRVGAKVAAGFGFATVLSALVCLAQYVHQGCFGGADARWLAGAQKITSGLLIAFMVRLSWCTRTTAHDACPSAAHHTPLGSERPRAPDAP